MRPFTLWLKINKTYPVDGEGPERNQGAEESQRRLRRRNDDRSRKWESFLMI